MPPTKDLGTYHVRVEFSDGGGFIQEWSTGRRYMYGTGSLSPLGAGVIEPAWEDEESLFSAMIYQYLDGNYSCDCNRRAFLAAAAQEPDPDVPCGDTLDLAKLTAIRPDGSEEVLWEA